MKLNFLCTHHRNWLEQNPSAALSTCISSYEQGLDLVEESNFRGAANHAGCALEAAQILMASGTEVNDAAVGRFSDSGVLLVYALLHLGENKLASNVHGGVTHYLDGLLRRLGAREGLVSACERWIKLSDEIGLYPALGGMAAGGVAVQIH